MTVDWSLECDGSVLVLRSGPHFSSQDLMDAIRAATTHPTARLPVALLFDNRGSKESASHEELKKRATFVAANPNLFSGRMAVVVSDDLHFGLARIGASYAETRGVAVQVFKDLDSARDWLLRGTEPIPTEPDAS